MNKIPPGVLKACVAVGLALAFGVAAHASSTETITPVIFFDVSDLPARIDGPSLSKSHKEFVLDCAVANRSGEELLGIRLILMVIDPAGKLRSRIAWTERAALPMYSIGTFEFHPELTLEVGSADQIFLAVDEVFGRETIWRAAGAEKALRAYARGQQDVVPTVRTMANKYDPRPGMMVIR